jgi:uncharacterized protein YndB with AHSA1/START domain
VGETERAVFKVFIQGSIEAVWREVTKTDEVQRAMFNMRLESDLTVGGTMRMVTKNGKYTGVVGEILEFDPPRRYVHTFKFTSYDDPPCKVAYDLKEVAGGVEFTLTVDDLPKGTKTGKQMVGGGKMIVANVKRIVEKGDVSFGIRMLYAMFRVMEVFTPAKLRSENWK